MKIWTHGLAAALALACALPAAAQTAGTLVVKDGAGSTRQLAGQSDSASGFHYRHVQEGLTSAGAPDALLTDGAGHLQLMNGAATAAAQATGNGSLASLVTNTSGLALHSDVLAILAALGTPLQAGGAVTVSNMPATQAISAATLPLPAGAATAARQDALLTVLGTPLQAGGPVTVTGGPTATAQNAGNTSLASIATNTAATGIGGMAAVPAGSTNGTALTLPAGSRGLRFYLGSADTVTFTIATSAPSSAPAATYTISGASSGTGPNWDENLSGSAAVYVTAKTGAPVYRPY